MKSESNIRAAAASKSINKWVRKFEKAFRVKAKGKRPVRRIKSIISAIKQKIEKIEKKSKKKRRKKA